MFGDWAQSSDNIVYNLIRYWDIMTDHFLVLGFYPRRNGPFSRCLATYITLLLYPDTHDLPVLY